jgi:hypothetical protein
MKAIGGYFELELRKGKEYHEEAIRLNTARNALKYLLKANKYNKIYLPYFTCDVILQPLQDLSIIYEFYKIDDRFEPIFDFNRIRNNEAFLYTNYFGLKDDFISFDLPKLENIIIDNVHSFFSQQMGVFDSFNSPRKFFGVPDGAYLYSKKALSESFDIDYSYNRMQHLLKRIDIGADAGYNDFVMNDKSLNNSPIRQMSSLSKSILCSLEYDNIARTRRENYQYLAENLNSSNLLQLTLNNSQVPLTYPYLSNKKYLRNSLIENKIFTARYWPNVLNWVNVEALEYKFSEDIIHLPIDQRYGQEDLDFLIEKIIFF